MGPVHKTATTTTTTTAKKSHNSFKEFVLFFGLVFFLLPRFDASPVMTVGAPIDNVKAAWAYSDAKEFIESAAKMR